jgi:hypothetical protein
VSTATPLVTQVAGSFATPPSGGIITRGAERLPFTGESDELPGGDWTWVFSILSLGAGIVIAVVIRRLLVRE